MLKVFAEVVSDEQAPPGDFLNQLRDRLRPCLPVVRRLAALDRPIQCLDRSTHNIVELRNAIAHGEGTKDLRRIQIDAIKRTLALERPSADEPTILQGLLTLCLEPATH
ncbi:hypothetical protein OV079_23265 [Nannocystis pusilla]|uniref:RiboL-PSP-HEPN domain-containing protein n=1 Tax=Nannocystis pusilla TaxID=889268 RepID=A0A9X3EQT3_9BACT|nr:hypothetical protein [Nannocystis pusilla]MCY1008422.1 hypothetical protein [Nannocystis pusilla]